MISFLGTYPRSAIGLVRSQRAPPSPSDLERLLLENGMPPHEAAAHRQLQERERERNEKAAIYAPLRAERAATREITSLPSAFVTQSILDVVRYAHATFAPEVKDGVEIRCGGLLVVLADWYEPGMITPWRGANGNSLPPQIVTHPEVYLRKGAYANGASLLPDGRPGLTDILMDYERNDPHSNNHDQALFIDKGGEIMTTRAHIEGARDYELAPEPNGHTGGTRFSAGRYITQENADAIAIMLSAGRAKMYVMQHGRVKMCYNLDGRTLDVYEPLRLEHGETYDLGDGLFQGLQELHGELRNSPDELYELAAVPLAA